MFVLEHPEKADGEMEREESPAESQRMPTY